MFHMLLQIKMDKYTVTEQSFIMCQLSLRGLVIEYHISLQPKIEAPSEDYDHSGTMRNRC